MTSSEVTRFVGIDPGAHTGLCCVDTWREPRRIGAGADRKIRLVGLRRIGVPERKALTAAERRGMFALMIRDQLIEWGAERVVLERPSDRTDAWKQSTGGERVNPHAGYQTGTAFSLGNAYGLAEAAVAFAGLPMTSYTVREWMPQERTGRFVHTMQRDRLKHLLYSLLREAGATGVVRDDERMAFGVVYHHLTRVVDATPQLPLLADAGD